MRRNAANTGTELDGRLGLERRLALAAGDRERRRRAALPMGRASCRAAMPLNQSAATAPTAVANNTKNAQVVAAGDRASAPLARPAPTSTRSGNPGRSSDRKPKSVVEGPIVHESADRLFVTDDEQPLDVVAGESGRWARGS